LGMFLNQKSIPYMCCQMITAINARIFLGGEPEIDPRYDEDDLIRPPDFGSWMFENLVDITKCRYGSCLCVERAWRHLRLAGQAGPWWSLEWIRHRLVEGRPVAVSGLHPKVGGHSALAVGADWDRLLLVNWNEGEETTWLPHKSLNARWNYGPFAAFSRLD